jgi:hypothetical protein
MIRTYTGSCHCGKVRFEADIDLSGGTGRCNCSICSKQRWWSVIVQPEALRVLSGESELADYEFGSHSVHHLFCRHCGIRPFVRGHVAEIGGHFCSINLATLDDVEPTDLIAAPLRYMDGLHNQWDQPPAETRHL